MIVVIVMLLFSNILLLFSAVTSRREFTILFNRVAIIILLYSGIIGYDSLYVTYLDTGIGIYNGLFHSTAITHSFDLFIYIIGAMISSVTGLSPSSAELLLSVAPFGLINLDQAEKEFTSIENKFKSDSSPSGHPHEEKDKTNPG